jgi:serum/glucocorticoid-regulated kinase 2
MSQRTLSIDDFTLIRLIGKGSYGKVLLVRKNDTGELLAMKMLRKDFIAKRNQIEHTRTERSVLEKVNHPFIVKLRYAFRNSKKLYFVLEYCPGGELFFHLGKVGRFDETRACFYAACMVLALEHLHKNDIVYRE